MNSGNPGDRADHEVAINALIDGELGEADLARLKAAAADDPVLAEAIADAWRLHEQMQGLPLERAPARLSRRLRRIPREQRRSRASGGRPRWLLAGGFAAVAVAAVAVLLLATPEHRERAGAGGVDDLARVEAARRDLAIAFHYLDKVGDRTGDLIQQVMHEDFAEPVTGQLSRHMPYTVESRKEKQS